jgi:hypothetical protein
MRRIFAGLAGLNLLVVLVQFYLAAVGAFADLPTDESFDAHRALGYVTFVLPVLMAIWAPLAGLPRRFLGLSLAMAALVSVQVLIAKVAEGLDDGGTWLFGLHGINGLVILAVAGAVAYRAAVPSSLSRDRRRPAVRG